MKVMKVYGDWSYLLLLINLGNRWRWVSSFTLQPLYPKERARYPLQRKMFRPQSWPGRFGEENGFLTVPGMEPVS
jgi:hypothetical protein